MAQNFYKKWKEESRKSELLRKELVKSDRYIARLMAACIVLLIFGVGALAHGWIWHP